LLSVAVIASVAGGAGGGKKDNINDKDFSKELPRIPPKEPADALKTIQVPPGFHVELVASEPAIRSPVAIDFDEDGRMYVIEFPEYNVLDNPKFKEKGAVKVLESTKGDWKYDKVSTYVKDLDSPVAVACWDGGVFVGAVPELLYMKRTAEQYSKEIIYTGFAKDRAGEAMFNSFRWGLDNRFHVQTSAAGGKVRRLGAKESEAKDVRSQFLIFDPRTHKFELTSGGGQHGFTMDDWGNKFVCDNSNPCHMIMYDGRYVARNPYVQAPPVSVNIAEEARTTNLKRISPPEPWRVLRTKLRVEGAVPGPIETGKPTGHFTGTTGVTVYRGDAFPKEYHGNIFVGEVANNLVYRAKLVPNGIGFIAKRADPPEREFLASSDNWFRPTMIQVGPDGALWIADMYRYVIEHPEWIPKDWQKKLDLRAGHDKGRIYRVYPADKKPRAIPRFDGMAIEDVVKQLESPNGWTRDTAHQIIAHGRYLVADVETAMDALKDLAANSKVPQARLHAMYAGNVMPIWTYDERTAFMKDLHPDVRKHGIALAEGFNVLIRESPVLTSLEKDQGLQVRQQLGYTLGNVYVTGSSAPHLIRLICDSADNPHVLAAGLSSIRSDDWKNFFNELLKEKKIPAPVFVPLLRMAKAVGEPFDTTKLLTRQLAIQDKLPTAQMLVSVGELLDAMDNNDMSLKKLLESAGEKDTGKTLTKLKEIHGDAVKIFQNPTSAQSEKMVALRLLGQGLGNDNADHKILLAMLTPKTPDDVQAAVIRQIARQNDPRVPGLLIEPWKTYSPALRGQVLDTLFSRALWTKMTVNAIKDKRVPAQEIDAIRRQRLVNHKDKDIREASAKLFASSSNPDRGKVVDVYWLQLPAKADAKNGAKLFTKACATCHKLGDVGQNVGPDLASVGDKSVQGLLTAILDPNRAVESRYINYAASTKSGKTYNGIIASETSTSITLVGNDGKSQQLLRNELDELFSTGKSLMPEGLEKDITPKEMGDIIEFIRTNKAAEAPKKRLEFPGNEPTTVRMNKDGVFRLLPSTAAVYGKTIVIEEKYRNFGFWSSPEDHVVWTVEAERADNFDVWLYYACATDSAGNKLTIDAGDKRLTFKVPSTGSWDEYRGEKIGTLNLTKGTQEIVIGPDGPIRGALVDLKKVELSVHEKSK
jgi:putative membrane-bound dehydrogenase-like protein